MDPKGTARLLSAILWELPTLAGAACCGRHELYDDVAWEDPVARRKRHHLAREVCGECPERHHLLKRRSRVQDQCSSATAFGKITGSGQIGHSPCDISPFSSR